MIFSAATFFNAPFDCFGFSVNSMMIVERMSLQMSSLSFLALAAAVLKVAKCFSQGILWVGPPVDATEMSWKISLNQEGDLKSCTSTENTKKLG